MHAQAVPAMKPERVKLVETGTLGDKTVVDEVVPTEVQVRR